MKSNALRAVRSNDVRAPRFRTTPPPAASMARRDAAANSANAGKPSVPVVPVGYRQGFITAISVLLAFTLAFWRY